MGKSYIDTRATPKKAKHFSVHRMRLVQIRYEIWNKSTSESASAHCRPAGAICSSQSNNQSKNWVSRVCVINVSRVCAKTLLPWNLHSRVKPDRNLFLIFKKFSLEIFTVLIGGEFRDMYLRFFELYEVAVRFKECHCLDFCFFSSLSPLLFFPCTRTVRMSAKGNGSGKKY